MHHASIEHDGTASEEHENTDTGSVTRDAPWRSHSQLGDVRSEHDACVACGGCVTRCVLKSRTATNAAPREAHETAQQQEGASVEHNGNQAKMATTQHTHGWVAPHQIFKQRVLKRVGAPADQGNGSHTLHHGITWGNVQDAGIRTGTRFAAGKQEPADVRGCSRCARS